MAPRPRPVVAMLFVLCLLAALPAMATLPTVHVTYHAALADGAFPASLLAKATVTWMSVSDPAILSRPQTAVYDPATGTATWTLPANCQAYFECLSVPLSGTYDVGAVDELLNDLVPVSVPAETPAWAANMVPNTGATADVDLGRHSLSALTLSLNAVAAPSSSGVTITPTTGGALTGAYRWYMSYTTAAGETEAGYLGLTTLTSQAALLSGLPIGGTGVVSRKLYRTVAAGYYPYYLVADIGNTATTYTDTTVDGSLGAVSQARNTTGGWLTTGGERVFQVDGSGLRIGRYLGDGGLSGTNIQIGDYAGPVAGTGHDEIFMGYGSGQYVRNGAGDVGIGSGTLGNASNVPDDAHRRTAIGINALFGAPGSSNTTAVGEFAGIYATGTDGVYLGSQRGMNETRNGWLHIGNQYKDLIYGDITNGAAYINGTLNVSGNVTAPNISAPPDLTNYARKDTAQSWPARQEFLGGALIGGQASSDVEPAATVISGQGAYPLAVTHTVGGNLTLSGGLGQSSITVLDWSQLYGEQIGIILNSGLPTAVTYAIHEGIEYSAQTSNSVTATNLAAAINAWCPGLWAQASGAMVALIPASSTVSIATYANSSLFTVSNTLPGTGYLAGTWETTDKFSVNGILTLDRKAKTVNSGTSTLQLDGGVVYDVSGPVVGTITGGEAGRLILLRWTDTVGGLSAGAFTPAPGMPTTYTAVVGGWMVLFHDGSTWVEQGRWPLGTTKTLSWYGATTSGGAVTTQFTLTISGGVITGATP